MVATDGSDPGEVKHIIGHFFCQHNTNPPILVPAQPTMTIGLSTSQNSQKLDDQIAGLTGYPTPGYGGITFNEDEGYHGDQISYNMPGHGHLGSPGRRGRSHPTPNQSTRRAAQHNNNTSPFMTTAAATPSPIPAISSPARRINQASPHGYSAIASPQVNGPGGLLGIVNAITATTAATAAATAAATLLGSDASVEVMCPDGNVEVMHPDGTVAKLPNAERTHGIQRYVAQRRADTRAKGTQKLYGSMKDPSERGGYLGEFAKWCKAGPQAYVCGMETDAGKQPYDVIPTIPMCTEFMSMHFMKRPQWDGRAYTRVKAHSKSNVENCMKALKGLYDYQAGVYPGGLEKYKFIFGDRPNSNLELTGLKSALASETAAERRDKHLKRGKASLGRQGYNRDQNRQMFEFGLTNDSKDRVKGLNTAKCMMLRNNHTISNNMLLRYNCRTGMMDSQVCSVEAPGKLVGQHLACMVLDNRKMNKEGNPECVYSLRHLNDPMRCSWNALIMEKVFQNHVLDIGPEV
jgi:hypothetical protein